MSAWTVAVLADSPLLFYRLNDSGGTASNAVSPGTNDGTYTGTGATQQYTDAGTLDGDTALYLPGDPTNTVTASAPSGLTTNGSFSLEFLAKPQAGSWTGAWSGNPTATSLYGAVFSAYSTLTRGTLLLYDPWGQRFGVSADADISNYLWSSGPWPVAPASYYHVVYTWNASTGTETLYVNGSKSASRVPASSGTPTPNANLGLVIGADTIANTLTPNPYTGGLDDLALYGAALSAAQVATHYAALRTPPAAAYPLASVTGLTAGQLPVGSSTTPTAINPAATAGQVLTTIDPTAKTLGWTDVVNAVAGTASEISASAATGSVTLALAAFGGGAGTYAYPSSIQLDSKGRVQAITAGSAPPGGTVTSVNLSTPSDLYTVSGGPITSSGTLALAKATGITANTVLAGPTSGSAAAWSLRALVTADLPLHSVGMHEPGGSDPVYYDRGHAGTNRLETIAREEGVHDQPTLTGGTLYVTFFTAERDLTANQVILACSNVFATATYVEFSLYTVASDTALTMVRRSGNVASTAITALTAAPSTTTSVTGFTSTGIYPIPLNQDSSGAAASNYAIHRGDRIGVGVVGAATTVGRFLGHLGGTAAAITWWNTGTFGGISGLFTPALSKAFSGSYSAASPIPTSHTASSGVGSPLRIWAMIAG